MKRLLIGFMLLGLLSGNSRAAQKSDAIIKAILNTDPKSAPVKKIIDPNSAVKADQKSNEPLKKEETPALGRDDSAPIKKRPARRKRIIAAVPTPDKILLDTGVQLYHARSFVAALKKFNELKTAYPQSPLRDKASMYAGKINLAANRVTDAIADFSSIAETAGDFPAAQYHLGLCHSLAGQRAQAIASFYRVSAQYPEYYLADDALIELAKLYLAAGKGEQSLEASLKIIKDYSDQETVPQAYYLAGKVFETDPRIRDIETARTIYQIFLKKSRDRGNRYFYKSPLKKRVKRDLRRIERIYFKMEE